MPVDKDLIWIKPFQDCHIAPRLKRFKRRNSIFVSDLDVIFFLYLLAVKPMLFVNGLFDCLIKAKDKSLEDSRITREQKNISV